MGVFPRVFKARKRAFSAPKIWTVEAGNLARFVKEPAWEMSLAATVSPNRVVRLGAIVFILDWRYVRRLLIVDNKFNKRYCSKNTPRTL